MLWCIRLAPASAFSFGALEHFPQKWEKESEMLLINETENMWLYKLRKIKLLVLFRYNGKLSHRSSGWQVHLLFPYLQAANPSDRWCFIALQCAMGEKNPQQIQIPIHAMLFPPQPTASSFLSQSSQLLSTPSLPSVISLETCCFIK